MSHGGIWAMKPAWSPAVTGTRPLEGSTSTEPCARLTALTSPDGPGSTRAESARTPRAAVLRPGSSRARRVPPSTPSSRTWTAGGLGQMSLRSGSWVRCKLRLLTSFRYVDIGEMKSTPRSTCGDYVFHRVLLQTAALGIRGKRKSLPADVDGGEDGSRTDAHVSAGTPRRRPHPRGCAGPWCARVRRMSGRRRRSRRSPGAPRA
jgi:hypothetical protein